MKTKTSHKIIFFLNIIFSGVLIFLYTTSYISPKDVSGVGIYNLLTIPFIIINVFFLIFWTLKLKKFLLLPLIVLLLGIFHFNKLFKLSTSVYYMEDGLNVMSYNVMQFYSLSDRRKNTYEDIKAFVEQEQPDVLCFQEYSTSLDGKFEKYKYKVKNDYKENLKTTIFSKYPIINSEPLDFDSSNSGILADIVVRNDTVRVFSIHFESLNLHPDIDIYVEKPRLKFKQFKRVFPRQIDQFEIVKQHIVSSPYPVILCADTNNTPLSYLYNSLTSIGLEDTFKEAGKGYGSTFVFHGVPIRIDMIFKSEELKTLDFKNYDVKHSDHYPIMAKIKL